MSGTSGNRPDNIPPTPREAIFRSDDILKVGPGSPHMTRVRQILNTILEGGSLDHPFSDHDDDPRPQFLQYDGPHTPYDLFTHGWNDVVLTNHWTYVDNHQLATSPFFFFHRMIPSTRLIYIAGRDNQDLSPASLPAWCVIFGPRNANQSVGPSQLAQSQGDFVASVLEPDSPCGYRGGCHGPQATYRAELRAAIAALTLRPLTEEFTSPRTVVIVTDSEYLQSELPIRCQIWSPDQWCSAAERMQDDWDLWEPLLSAMHQLVTVQGMKIRFWKVSEQVNTEAVWRCRTVPLMHGLVPRIWSWWGPPLEAYMKHLADEGFVRWNGWYETYPPRQPRRNAAWTLLI